jgi:chaperonin GroEL (HSP60 family)
MEDNKKLVSTYNQAIAQLTRLDRAWNACNHYSSIGELNKWKWQLDVIWRELIADSKIIDHSESKDENTYSYKINLLNSKIAKCKTKIELYNALSEKEQVLRILEDESGKGSKRSSDDEDDFDE